MNNRLFTGLLFLLILACTAFSQPDDSYTTAFLSYAVPTGAFGATSGSDAGFAKSGFGFGYDMTSAYDNGLHYGGFFSICFIPMDKTELEKQSTAATGYPTTVTTGNWNILWGLAKLGYEAELTSHSNVYGDGYAGIAGGFIPKMETRTQISSSSATTTSQNSASGYGFAYGFGGGVYFKNGLSLGVKYLSSEIEYSVTRSSSSSSTSTSSSEKVKQPTSMLLLNLGYNF